MVFCDLIQLIFMMMLNCMIEFFSSEFVTKRLWRYLWPNLYYKIVGPSRGIRRSKMTMGETS